MEHVLLSLIVAFALDISLLKWGVSWSWQRAIRAAAVLNSVAFAVLVGFFILPVSELFFWLLIAPIYDLPAPVFMVLATAGFTILNMAIKWPLFVVLFRPTLRRRTCKLLSISSLICGAVFVTTIWYQDQVRTIPQQEITWLETEYAPEIAFLNAWVDEMNSLGYAPWRDPNWSRRMKAEGSQLRFQWLELRYTSHERITLLNRGHKQPNFHAQIKKDHLWVLRGVDEGNRIYRYAVIKQKGREGSLEAIGDFGNLAD